MVFAGLLAGIGRQYLTSAMRTFSAINATAGGTLGNFNMALLDQNNSVEITNLAALEAQLKEFGPKVFNDFKRDARKLGTPARNSVRKAFSDVGAGGPFGGFKRPGRNYDGWLTTGRVSWGSSYADVRSNKGIDVNYKSRTANRDAYNLKTGKDGNLSVVRIRVRKPALIIADMAGRKRTSMYNNNQFVTRPYKINLFGRGVVERTHRINARNSDRFVDRLRTSNARLKTGASRYAWPALEAHVPEYTRNVDTLLNRTISEVNRTLGR